MSIVTLADDGDRTLRRKPDALSTGSQDAVIRAWLAMIKETDESIVGDGLAQCRHDEDARQYFVGRAGECITPDTDDRRRCDQCGNSRWRLRGREASRPGVGSLRLSASDLHPPAVPGLPACATAGELAVNWNMRTVSGQ